MQRFPRAQYPPYRILFFGIQGSGKGTQARLLKERKQIAHIAPGDIFREEVARGSELGKEVEIYMRKGVLVPDTITLKVLREHLVGDAMPSGWILDGFPRNSSQKEGLDHLLDDLSLSLTHVFVLELRDAVVKERLLGRRSCPECGMVYNIVTQPPITDEVCDVCGHHGLQKRSDETEDAIAQRIEIFYSQTRPLLDYYEQKSLLIRIDAERTVEEIHRDILSYM